MLAAIAAAAVTFATGLCAGTSLPIAPGKWGDRVLTLSEGPGGQLTCYELYDYLDVLLDPDEHLTNHDVASPNLEKRFAPNRTRDEPLDVATGAVWLRFRVRNTLPYAHVWWLSPGYWGLAELYTSGPGGFAVSRAGSSVTPPARLACKPGLRFYRLKLAIPGGLREMTVYLRLLEPLDRRRGRPLVAILHQELHLPIGAPVTFGLDLTPGSSGKLSEHGLYGFSEVLADPQERLIIADVSAGPAARQFTYNNTLAARFEAGHGAIWMRLRLHSQLSEDHTWWLFPRYWGVAELYVPSGGGYKVFRSGAFVPPAERAAPEANPRLYFLPLPVPSGLQDLTIYLRLHRDLYLGPDRGVVCGLYPELQDDWRRPTPGFLLLQAGTLGVLLSLGVYHAFLFVRVRERIYLLFALAVVGRGLLIAADSRLMLEYVWPNAPRWDFVFRLFQGPMWVVPFFLFFMAFLDTRVWAPRTSRALQLILVPSLLEPLFTWFRPSWFGTLLSVQWLTWGLVPIVVAFFALRRNRRQALIFLAANTVMLGYTIAYTLGQAGIRVPLPRWGYFAGEILSVLLFSAAVSEHIRGLRRQRDLAHQGEADARTELNRHKLEADLLAAELREARLQALDGHLRPHFLFNALNSIACLIHQDTAAAERTLVLLGDLLRATLDGKDVCEVLLGDEVAFVTRYLEIERTRFPTRLSVSWEIDPETVSALVPHLLLQPLAENAVRHGIAPRARPGTVWIRSWRAGRILHLQVRDDGVGAAGEHPPHQGVGLANTRARLSNLYGDDAHLTAHAVTGGGFEVLVTLPFHVQAGQDPPRPVGSLVDWNG